MSEEREYSFLWEIENFNFFNSVIDDAVLDSPSFKTKDLNEASWHLRLYPRGDEDGYMSCYLNREFREVPSEIECEYEIQVLSSEGTILKSVKESNTFQEGSSWGFSNFWKKSLPLSENMEVLRLRCLMKFDTKSIPLRLASKGRTMIGVDKYSFKWMVYDLNSNCSKERKFSIAETSQFQISAQVFEDDIMISIHKFEGRLFQTLLCRITLLDLEGGNNDSKEDLHIFKTVDDVSENEVWRFPNFLKKSYLNAEREKYLNNDCFFLKCKIIYSNEEITELIQDLSPTVTGTKGVLKDYRRLYKNRIHSDVKLLVGDEIIQAHKCILSIRSPVFLAMFGADMVENETGSVTILDLDAKTIKSLLEHIYTGTVDKLDCKMAMKLIVAADKYQVLSLKEECADLLKCFLSHENVCNVLVVADLIQHEFLKEAALIYLKNNSKCIFLSKEWKSVVEKNLPLATETVQKVSMLIAAGRKKNDG